MTDEVTLRVILGVGICCMVSGCLWYLARVGLPMWRQDIAESRALRKSGVDQ